MQTMHSSGNNDYSFILLHQEWYFSYQYIARWDILIYILYFSGPTIQQTVGGEMKMEKDVLAVDHKRRLGHVQI